MSIFTCGSGDVSFDGRSIVNRPSIGIKSTGFVLSKIDQERDIPISDSTLPLIKENEEVIAVICGNSKDGYTLKAMKGVTITDEMVPKINNLIRKYNLMMDNYKSDPRS